MKFTVTLKVKAKDGSVYWGPQEYVEASDEFAAVRRVIKLYESEYDGVVLAHTVKLYNEADEDKEHFIAVIKRLELEDEIKEAPANIARALDSIAHHTLKIEENTENIAKRSFGDVFNWVAAVSLIISLTTTLLLILRG